MSAQLLRGLKRSLPQVEQFLKQMGLKCRKVGCLPAKADPAGRQRFNVLAALNAVTHDLVMVTNERYLTATSVCELLQQVSALKLGLSLTLVLDNARYQKCALVQALAATLNIELLYLPAYSPNLNLIERLWKFVNKEALYSKYYQEFTAFKAAITAVLNETSGKHKQALDSLLTLRFQTFEKSQIMTL